MKKLLIGLTLLASMSAFAANPFTKKCLELDGEASGVPHYSIEFDFKPVWSPTVTVGNEDEINENEEKLKAVSRDLMDACSQAVKDPRATMSTNVFKTRKGKAGRQYFCFISID